MKNNDPIGIDGGPVNSGCRQRTARRWLTLALTIAAGSLPGCGDLADDLETVKSALTTTRTLNFGTVQRALKRDCGQRCTQFTVVGGSLHGIQCQQWVPDCSVPGPLATLHANAAAAASNSIFPAYNEGPSWQYSGCGPQAAQNVLNYYGIQMPIAEVEQYIPTFALVAGSHDQNIASFPDDLADGLQRLFNEMVAPGRFIVSRRSGVVIGNELDKAMRNGNPLIMLVNNGTHYQVATGADLTRAYVVDYAGNDQWRSQSDLGMDLPWYSDLFSTVSFGAGGYEDDTVITIDSHNYPHGFLIQSDRDSTLAVNAWGGAAEGRVLRLHDGCSTANRDCTWSYRGGMIVSDSDPSLAINAVGGALEGTVLGLTRACRPDNPDCTWTYKNGEFLSDRNTALAINAGGGAQFGTTLVLAGACTASNPDCTWTIPHVALSSGRDPTLAINPSNGAAEGTSLKLSSACAVGNPDCTWTFWRGMIVSDRNAGLAVNAWGGAANGVALKLTSLCTSANPDCTWTWTRGQLVSDRSPLPINAFGGAVDGAPLLLNSACTPTNPDCLFAGTSAGH